MMAASNFLIALVVYSAVLIQDGSAKANQVCYSQQRLDAHSVMVKTVDCDDPLVNFTSSFDSNEGGSFADILAHINPRKPKVASEKPNAVTGPITTTPDGGLTDPEIIQCPTNMVYGNCSRCIATCADPSGTGNCSNDCTDYPLTCVCPPNHLMDGPNCVLEEQCGCHLHSFGVIAESAALVALNCSECTCNSGVLACDTSPCAQEATCKVVDGVRGCVCNEGYVGDGQTCTRGIQQDCSYLSTGSASKDYQTSSGWILNCNMTIDGGGWTVIQRHYLSSSRQDFHQDWAMYRHGFGDSSGEFWIGNEIIFNLTSQRDYEIRIDMVNTNHASYYAKYDLFRITGESDNYRLSELGTFTGTAGYDALRAPENSAGKHLGMYFSTHDRDNDRNSGNCAAYYYGGWWWNNCDHFILNYGNSYSGSYVGRWYHLPGDDHSIYTEMKIRPREA